MQRLPREVRYEAWCRRCPACDYDLAGLPEQCQCPECAQAIGNDLHSASVWWREPPSAVLFAMMLVMATFCNLGLLGALIAGMTGGIDLWTAFWVGLFAIGFSFGAVDSFVKLRTHASGATDARLHISPRLIGLWYEGNLWWHEWDEVRAIRFFRPWYSRYWIVRVKGRRKWYMLGKRRTLIKAAARWNSREAAIVRNTLLRYWRRVPCFHRGA